MASSVNCNLRKEVNHWVALILFTAIQYCTPIEDVMADQSIRLSTRDKKLKAQLQLSPEELMLDELSNQSDASLSELVNAISSVKPGINRKGINKRQILESELSRIKDSMAPVGLGITASDKAITQPESTLTQVRNFLSNMWGTP